MFINKDTIQANNHQYDIYAYCEKKLKGQG